MKKTFALTFLTVVLIFAFGCSNNSSTPISPSSDSDGIPVFFSESADTGNHQLWQKGTIEIDLESMTAEAVPDRMSTAHLNITSYIAPQVNIISFDPVNWIVGVGVGLYNSYPVSGYDLRLIIYADNVGHRLLNFDAWTSLYDNPADYMPINPFKAFLTFSPIREVRPSSGSLAMLNISIPGGNTSIGYAIDVSFPENCVEPYHISDFNALGMKDQVGSSATASVQVHSWRTDVNSVQLYLPQVTGTTLVPFTEVDNIHWEMELVNNTGAPAGEHIGFIVATTTGSGALALYQKVILTISEYVPPDCADPPSITNSPDEGQEGFPYNFQFRADDGELPLTWSIVSGILPTQLTLRPDGRMMGEIDCGQIGEFEFTVEVTDSCEEPQSDVQIVQMNVIPQQCDLLDITDAQTVPDATEATPYFYTFEFTGGYGLKTWELSSGTLPTGMVFLNGTITGAPDLGTEGDYPLAVQVTDSCCTPQVDIFEFTLSVLPRP